MRSRRMLAATTRGIAMATVAAIYIVGAQIAVNVQTLHELPTLLWAPTGFAFGAVLVFGPSLAVAAAVGAAAGIISVHGDPASALFVGTVGALEILGGYFILRALHFRPALDRMRDVLLLVTACIAVTFLAASLTATTLFMWGRLHHEWTAMWTWWWWSHISGQLIITPLFVTWVVARHRRVRLVRALEAMLLAASLVLVAACVFEGAADWLPVARMPHYLFPLLLWAALRFGPRGAATANATVAVIAIFGVAAHRGPFDTSAEFQSFISISAITTLALSAINVDVKRAIRRKGALQYNALDGIITIDGDDRIIEFNPAAEQLFRISEHDALGRDIKSLFVPRAIRDSLPEGLSGFLRKRGGDLIGQRVRFPAQRADGSEFPAEIGIIRMPLDDEDLYSAVVRDITVELEAEHARREAHQTLERTVAERTKALRRKEELLNDSQALAHLGSFEFDLTNGDLQWSEEMFRIYGNDPATFKPTYDGFLRAVFPGDRSGVARMIKRAIDSATPFNLEERIIRSDGSVRILQSQGRVRVNDRGEATHLIGCCQDITERKRAEAERYRLAELVESSQDAIIGLSTDGVIETWNASAERMFGYSTEEVVGRRADLLVPPDAQDSLEKVFTAARAGQYTNSYELMHRRKNGSVFEASVTMSAILDHDGNVLGLSKVMRDTTEQKKSRELLEESLREKEVLLREIHHRVKNNLQVISSLLNLQVASMPSDEARKGLLESQSRIQSMALLHQLLYQSKDLGRIELGDYLRALVEYLVSTYADSSGRVTASVSAPSVRLDLDRSIPCGLIVNELVTNSFRHGFPDQRIGHIAVVVTQPEPSRLVLEVRDNGVGIPASIDLERAASFGLQIARSLAQQLEGTLAIERGHGTTVRVVFPINHRRDSAVDVARAAASP
jgi:PAS domain S-box-containing protein